MRPEQKTLAAALEVAERLAGRLRSSLQDLESALPISPAAVDGLDEGLQLRIDAFLKRFEQLQDAVSNRVVRALLIELGDDVAGYSARDAFDRAESLGALDDAARFLDIARLRNRLAHEYPMDDERRAGRLNAAFEAAPVLLQEYARLAAYARGHIGGST